MSSSRDEFEFVDIEVEGHLGPEWSTWFDGLAVRPTRDDQGRAVTAISGTLADQAALYGILDRLRDLGLTLRRVERSRLDSAAHPTTQDEDGQADERDDDSSD